MKKTIYVSGKEMKINISKENSKLGMIPSFSVIAGKEGYCKNECCKCYAKKLENMRKCVKKCNMENYNFLENIKECSTFDRLSVINQFVDIIDSLNCRVFRWNVSGDVDSEYMRLIINIARKLSDVNFYLYTKNITIVDKYIANICLTDNLIINLSIMHYSQSYLIDVYKNFGNIRFMITCRSKTDEQLYYQTNYHYTNDYCKQDLDNLKKCTECKECFNKWDKITFNEYRGLKVINNFNLININFLNLEGYNHFLHKALTEVYDVLINHTYTNVLVVEELMSKHKKTLIKTIKESNTFYIAICKCLDFLCSIIGKDYINIRQDIVDSSIFKASANVSENVKLYDNISDLKNEIERLFDKQDIKTDNIFNCECFRISNIIFNKIDCYKYRYCNIRRIVFQEVNRLMNIYCRKVID